MAVSQSCFEASVNAPLKKKKKIIMCEISQEADVPLQWPQYEARKTAHSLSLTLTGQGRRILHFGAVSFNNNLQGQSLLTQIEKHKSAERFWSFFCLKNEDTRVCKRKYLYLKNVVCTQHQSNKSQKPFNIHSTLHNIILNV